MKKIIKNIGFVMALMVVLMVAVVLLFAILCGQSPVSMLVSVIDLPSIVGILIFVVPAIFIMRIGSDFGKAFMLGARQYSLMQLKNTVEAVSTVQRLIVFAGIVEFVLGFIMIMIQNPSGSKLMANLAVAVLAIFYTAFFELIILPLKVNAVVAMNIAMDMDED